MCCCCFAVLCAHCLSWLMQRISLRAPGGGSGGGDAEMLNTQLVLRETKIQLAESQQMAAAFRVRTPAT